MNLIRPAHPNDLDGLFGLAEHLNTVNLPADEERLSEMLEDSVNQFEGSDAPDQAMIFVLEDGQGALRGSATIIARHGSPQAPHCFFDVIDEERYSPRLDQVFHHKVLRLGTSFVPRTEIGGLVLDPSLRGQGLGRFLSLCRFQFIAAYRERFCDYVLAELLPPFDEDGNSPLWHALGQRFTGLTYREADRLSGQEKEFIEDLFPRSDLHVSLFSRKIQSVIEQVGPNTKGALKLLLEQGFFYTKRIDPFDGGPHYWANTDEIACIRSTRALRARAGQGHGQAMVGVQTKNARDYRVCLAPVNAQGMQVDTDQETLDRLGVEAGEDLLVTVI
jgi:arginine N-succinyltransferase